MHNHPAGFGKGSNQSTKNLKELTLATEQSSQRCRGSEESRKQDFPNHECPGRSFNAGYMGTCTHANMFLLAVVNSLLVHLQCGNIKTNLVHLEVSSQLHFEPCTRLRGPPCKRAKCRDRFLWCLCHHRPICHSSNSIWCHRKGIMKSASIPTGTF